MKKSMIMGSLTLLLMAPSAKAQVTLPELPWNANYARAPLEDLASPRLAAVLEQLRASRGLTPRSDALVIPIGDQESAMVTELDDAKGSNQRLLLFLLPKTEEAFFFQLQVNSKGTPEMRIWGAGPSELVVAGDQMQLLEQPSAGTFRLSNGAMAETITVTDTIACIARSLGIGLDSTSLTARLSSALCSATSTITIVLTATNCLSIAGFGSNVVFATIGCINGIAKLLSCGYVSCNTSNCAVSTIYLNNPVSTSWTSACASTRRSGHYAKFYSFQLSSTRTVVIDLSSSTDPYLYLLRGAGTGGSVIAADNNNGPGLDSRIVVTLPPGSYTVEATTYSSGRTGSFLLSVR